MVTKAQRRATDKFEKNNYDKVLLRIRKDSKTNREAITASAQAVGESLNGYIMKAVKDRMIADGFLSGQDETEAETT